MDYYPFGSLKFDTATSSYDGEARKYIGQYSDSDGLSYLNARYYSPTQGQFLSEDPVFLALGNPTQLQQSTQQQQNQLLMDPQQLNSYSYGRDNPITNSDPLGKDIYGGTISFGAGYGLTLGANVNTDPWGVQLIVGPWGGFALGAKYQATYSKGGTLDSSGFYTSPSADVTPIIGDSISSEAKLDFSDWRDPKGGPPTPWAETTTFGFDIGAHKRYVESMHGKGSYDDMKKHLRDLNKS
jgi:RHS repeat-associated protein